AAMRLVDNEPIEDVGEFLRLLEIFHHKHRERLAKICILSLHIRNSVQLRDEADLAPAEFFSDGNRHNVLAGAHLGGQVHDVACPHDLQGPVYYVPLIVAQLHLSPDYVGAVTQNITAHVRHPFTAGDRLCDYVIAMLAVGSGDDDNVQQLVAVVIVADSFTVDPGQVDCCFDHLNYWFEVYLN